MRALCSLLAFTMILTAAAPPARADEPAPASNPTEQLLRQSSASDNGPTLSEPKSAIRPGHATRGVLSLPILGYALGSGIALRGSEPNPDIFMRQSHMVANIALLGLALYDVDDLLSLKQTKPQDKAHRAWSYAYLAVLAATSIAGFIQVRTHVSDYMNERDSASFRTWDDIHTGLAVAAAVTLMGSALTVHFD